MTSAKDKLFEQLQSRRDAKVNQTIDLLRVIATDNVKGKPPAVGDLVTLVLELGMSEEEIAQYIDAQAELQKVQAFLQTEDVQNHRTQYREHRRFGEQLKAEFELRKREHEKSLAEWARVEQSLDGRESDIRRAQRNCIRFQNECTALERKFRHLPPESPTPINVEPQDKLTSH